MSRYTFRAAWLLGTAMVSLILATGVIAESSTVQDVQFAPTPRLSATDFSTWTAGIANFGEVDWILEGVQRTSDKDSFMLLDNEGNVVHSISVPATEVTAITFSGPRIGDGEAGQLEFRLVKDVDGSNTTLTSDAGPRAQLLLYQYETPLSLPVSHRIGLLLAAVAAAFACWMVYNYWISSSYAKSSDGRFLSAGEVSLGRSWSTWYNAIVGGSVAIVPLLVSVIGVQGSATTDPLIFWGAIIAIPALVAPALIFTSKPTLRELQAMLPGGIDPSVTYRLVAFRPYLIAQALTLFSAFAFTGLAGAWFQRGYSRFGLPEWGHEFLPFMLVITVWLIGIQYAFRTLRDMIESVEWCPVTLGPVTAPAAAGAPRPPAGASVPAAPLTPSPVTPQLVTRAKFI